MTSDVLMCGVDGIDATGLIANTGLMARTVLILGYPGVQALDLVGPSEVFTGATLYLQSQNRADDGYTVSVVSQNGEPATTGTGLALVAQPLPDPRRRIDTVILPGVWVSTMPGRTPTSSRGSRQPPRTRGASSASAPARFLPRRPGCSTGVRRPRIGR